MEVYDGYMVAIQLMPVWESLMAHIPTTHLKKRRHKIVSMPIDEELPDEQVPAIRADEVIAGREA